MEPLVCGGPSAFVKELLLNLAFRGNTKSSISLVGEEAGWCLNFTPPALETGKGRSSFIHASCLHKLLGIHFPVVGSD